MATKPVKRRKISAVIERCGVVISDCMKTSSRSGSRNTRQCTFVHLLTLTFPWTAYFTHAQDCDASFGTNIVPKDCDAAIQDFIATSVRDEAWARGPVLRTFTRNRDDPTPRNVMPQGYPHQTCAIGFDLAGSSGQPVTDSYKNLVERINELVETCVVGTSKSRGMGGRMKFHDMVFVVSSPSIEAVQDTCLAFPKQHSIDLGECVAQRASRSPSPMLANATLDNDPSIQSGYSTLPDLQASHQGPSRQPNEGQATASQQPTHQGPSENIHPVPLEASGLESKEGVIMTPTMRLIRAEHPDWFSQIAQQVAEIEAHRQIGYELREQEQQASQWLAQQEQQPAAPGRSHLTSQQLAQQQLLQQPIIQQRLDQQRQLLQRRLIQQRLAQQRMQAQQPAQQRAQFQQLQGQQLQGQQLQGQQLQGQQLQGQQLQGQQLQGLQLPGQQQAIEQQWNPGTQRLRQQSSSPPHRAAPQGMRLRGRPGSEDSDETSMLGPSHQAPSLPMGPPRVNNLASQLNTAILSNNTPPMPNQTGPAEASTERPAQRQRLANQSPAPAMSISASEFGRMLQEYSVGGAGGSVGPPRRMSPFSLGSLLGPATSLFGPLPANEPDPNEVNQNPRDPNEVNQNPRPQAPTGKPPRPGKRRKGKDP